ncbi:ABC transporter substrate-binding protein [Paenibacillus solanacearum]|nr:extracellular solute-binding protein [Paenibacillus solanacearum]
MPNKRIRLSFALLPLCILTAACGGNGAGTATDAGADKSGKTPVSSEPVTLTFYMHSAGMSDDEYKRYVVEPVQKKYPNITLVMERSADKKVEDLIAAGTYPDIMTVDTYSVLKMKELEMAQELTSLAKANGFDRTKYTPTLMNVNDLYGKKGELYAIPWAAQYTALYYNKDIFDKFGVPYPKDGMTWDDVLALGRKVIGTDGNTQYYPLGSQVDAFYIYSQLSPEPLVNPATRKAQFNSEQWKTVFQLMKNITDLPNNKSGYGTGRDRFLKDKTLAMLPDWGSYASNLMTAENQGGAGMKWDLASYPTFKENPGVGPASGPFLMMVCSQSKHKQEAFQVISEIVSKENQLVIAKEGQKLPAMNDEELKKSFAANNPIMKEKNVQSIFKVKSAPIGVRTEYYDAANKPLKENLKKVAEGTMDMNTALRDAEEKANKAIQTQFGQ